MLSLSGTLWYALFVYLCICICVFARLTHESIIFDTLEQSSFQKYTTYWVFLVLHHMLYLCICVFVFMYLRIWHMGVSFLIPLNNPLFKNIPHIGFFWYFITCCICVFSICIFCICPPHGCTCSWWSSSCPSWAAAWPSASSPPKPSPDISDFQYHHVRLLYKKYLYHVNTTDTHPQHPA